MKKFMVHIRLPETPTGEFTSLLPSQRAMISSLMRKGIILSYTVSFDRTQVWVVMDAESEINVIEVLAEFPLIRFMKPEIHELLFHSSITLNIPSVSLN